MASAKLKSSVKVDIEITLKLTLREAEALEEITGYGADRFIEGYKKQLGVSYIRPHEKGIRELFGTIGSSLPEQIRQGRFYVKSINDAIKKKSEAKS